MTRRGRGDGGDGGDGGGSGDDGGGVTGGASGGPREMPWMPKMHIRIIYDTEPTCTVWLSWLCYCTSVTSWLSVQIPLLTI